MVTSPTLLIAGSDDDVLAETARILSDCQMITIEAGHWIHETEPNRFVKAVRSFLEALSEKR